MTQVNQRLVMADARLNAQCKQLQNSSVFNVWAKVLRSLQDLQLYD